MKALLALVFLLSGAVSLVYEVVWARLLSVHLGSTTEGHTVVIATFMGGLGLGYAWLGRRADTAANPLRLYASLEAGITLWALAFPWLVDGAAGLLGGGVPLAVVAVLVPTTLMGGTLPALTAALARRDTPGPTIAGLYGVNALGAALGVFVAGFWLIEALGVRSAGWAAAGVNGALALAAWGLARRGVRPPEAQEVAPASGAIVRWACVAACVVGFASMALQGAWIRLFAVVLGSSTYSFSLVIGTYICGMALGSLGILGWRRPFPDQSSGGRLDLGWRRPFPDQKSGGRLDLGLRRPFPDPGSGGRLLGCAECVSPLAALAALATGAALALWLTAPGFSALPFELAGLRETLVAEGASFQRYTATRLGLIAGLIVLPTLAFGAVLPLAARVAAVGRPGAGTGVVFAWNTVGAVAGAALSLPVLVPAWGLDGVHQAGAMLLALLGLVLGGLSVGRFVRPTLVVLALVALVGPLVVPVSWDPREVSAGAFRMSERKAETRDAFRERLHRSELVFHGDGPDATVCVLERKGDRVLMVNGKPDASTRGDMVTQVTSAHVPLVLHPDPKTALVVGLGSGVTVGSALRHPGVSVDVVEVSQAVVDASRYFDGASGAPLESARVRLTTDDVRSALRARPADRWDVIISEPSNPWVAGNAGLFSVDYFSLLASRVAPGGVVAQWVQRYETDDETLRMVIRSFGGAFEHVEIWQLYPTDLLLVGQSARPAPDLAEMARRLAIPAVSADLTRVGLPGLVGLLSLQAMTADGVRALLSTPGPVNTDDRPRLEFEGPRRLYAGERAQLVADHDVRVGRSAGAGWHLADVAPWSLEVLEQLFVFHTRYPGAPVGFRLGWIERLAAESAVGFLIDLLFTLVAEAHWEAAEGVAARLLVLAPDHPRALYVVARSRHGHAEATGLVGDRAGLRGLLDRCVALGDEARGRCARLLGRL